MIKECIEQIDPDLADSTLTMTFPDHTIDVWRHTEGEQVVVMTGDLDGQDRFRAVCVFTMGKTGSVSIHFKTGKHKDKRCSVPCGYANKVWTPTLAELKWDNEAT